MTTPNRTQMTMTAAGQALYATRPRNAINDKAERSMLHDGNLAESAKKKYDPYRSLARV
jgi:hypothetical protein